MKTPPPPPLDPNVLAVLHRSGKSWHVVLASREGARPSITTAREFPLDQASRIDAWLTEQRAGNVVCVLPASAVICRTVALPDAPTEQLMPALSLQAEAHLLGIAPPHRVAMAVLPASVGESTRAGLVLAWPEAAQFTAPVTSQPVRYIADVAALAALLNGLRPTDPLLWLDRGDGSVAIAMAHSGGATFRATSEEADNGESWQKSVGRIVAETGLSVGHTGAFIQNMVQTARAAASSVGPQDAALVLPKDVRDAALARLQGAKDDVRWWNDFGIAAGAVIALVGLLSPLGGMQHTPPAERPSRIRSALESLSRPRTAVITVVTCVLLLMFAPLVFSGLRLLALKVRYGDVAKQLTLARASRDQVAVYKELEKQSAWPMTKLLADVATNAPLGIELDSMRIDAGKDFSVSGTAIANGGKNPYEIVAQYQSNLREDGLFNDIAVSWGDATNLGVYKFDITAKVSAGKAFRSANYPPERDFGLWTHANRRDGVPMPKRGSKAPATQPDAGTLASADAGDASGRNAVVDGASASPEMGDGGDATQDSGLNENDTATESPDGQAMADAGDGGDEAADNPASSSSGTRRPAGGTGAGDDPTGSTGAISAGQIPPALSPEQIAAMTEPEVKEALTKVSKARQYARGNKELEDRLKTEFTQLMEQLKKVKGDGK